MVFTRGFTPENCRTVMNTNNIDKKIDEIIQKVCMHSVIDQNGVQTIIYERLSPYELKLAISALLDEARIETERAYGGCYNCYGKGYSTVNYIEQGFDDFAHEGYKLDKHVMKFCGCSRGKQLEIELTQLKKGRK